MFKASIAIEAFLVCEGIAMGTLCLPSINNEFD